MTRAAWTGFLLYCLLAGSTWIVSNYFTTTWPDLLRLCFHDAVLFLALIPVSILTRKRPGTQPSRQPGRAAWARSLPGIALWGALLLAAPVIALAGASGDVSGLTSVLVFALIPFFTVFLMAQTQAEGLESLLAAALPVGGLALIIPFHTPSNPAGWGWLFVLLVAGGLTALAGIRLRARLDGTPLVIAAGTIAGSTALLAGLAWFLLDRSPVDRSWSTIAMEAAWGLLIDGPLLLLLLWLIRRMNPVAASTRFILAPVATILGSELVMHPTVTWTTWLGLALAAGGAWRLLYRPSEVPLTLRGPL